jgi:hypothetical protein
MQRIAGWERLHAHPLYVQFGFVAAFVLLFGNEMLLISLFMSSLLTFLVSLPRNSTVTRTPFVQAILAIESQLVAVLRSQLVIAIAQTLLFIAGTLTIRIGAQRFLQIEDDVRAALSTNCVRNTCLDTGSHLRHTPCQVHRL